MIKTSFIAPLSLMDEYSSRGDFHLALAHLMDENEVNEYEQKLIDSRKPIYLDNGLFENKESVPLDELIKKAVRIGAEYVFAPDVLYNRSETEANIDLAWEALEKAYDEDPECKTKLAAVVQADNAKDYLESYEAMALDPRISLIGLSILSIPKSFHKMTGSTDISFNRIVALTELNKLEHHKMSHLLGAGSSYEDVRFAAMSCPWIDSHDSSSAVWNGVQRHWIQKDLRIKGGKTEVPVDFKFQDRKMIRAQHEAIENNITQVLLATNHIL